MVERVISNWTAGRLRAERLIGILAWIGTVGFVFAIILR